MEALSVVTFGTSLAAIAVATVVWVYQLRISRSIVRLEQFHASTDERTLNRLAIDDVDFTGVRLKRFIILGFGIEGFEIPNQSRADKVLTAQKTVKLPEGTRAALASLSGFWLGYGEAEFDANRNVREFVYGDHHLGFEYVRVDIVDLSPSELTAQLRVRMFLSDHNGDDKWFGGGAATILFLGEHP